MVMEDVIRMPAEVAIVAWTSWDLLEVNTAATIKAPPLHVELYGSYIRLLDII